MPKVTFLNLPETKRKAVFDAAVKEFSMYMYSDASINRIIKEAQIPRGSFYQYFVTNYITRFARPASQSYL